MSIPNVKFHQLLFYIGISLLFIGLLQFFNTFKELHEFLIEVLNGEYNTGDSDFDREKIDAISELYAKRMGMAGGLIGGAISPILVGAFIWYKKETFNIKKYCQSCGKFFDSMINYGTHKDKSLNEHFCSKCYKKGQFTNQELTKEQVFSTILAELKNKNIITKYFVKKHLNKLDRWKKHHYY